MLVLLPAGGLAEARGCFAFVPYCQHCVVGQKLVAKFVLMQVFKLRTALVIQGLTAMVTRHSEPVSN